MNQQWWGDQPLASGVAAAARCRSRTGAGRRCSTCRGVRCRGDGDVDVDVSPAVVVQVDTEGIYGSSTFCLVVIDRRRSRMHTACLGDSSIMVIGATPDEPEVPLPPLALEPYMHAVAAYPQ